MIIKYFAESGDNCEASIGVWTIHDHVKEVSIFITDDGHKCLQAHTDNNTDFDILVTKAIPVYIMNDSGQTIEKVYPVADILKQVL